MTLFPILHVAVENNAFTISTFNNYISYDCLAEKSFSLSEVSSFVVTVTKR